jgi:hypothetical protein
MNHLNISIYSNKIFLEIINEVKLFNEFKIKHYKELDLCVNDSKTNNSLAIFFVEKNQKSSFFTKKIDNFPALLIYESSTQKASYSSQIIDHLYMPMSILEFKKKVIYLNAKNEFKRNSLIELNGYTIDKNERKIKKENIELQLSEKEINFLILFSKNKGPISKDLVLKNVWNYSLESETHTVETHIHRLRKKIMEKFSDSNFIKNSNKGYFI